MLMDTINLFIGVLLIICLFFIIFFNKNTPRFKNRKWSEIEFYDHLTLLFLIIIPIISLISIAIFKEPFFLSMFFLSGTIGIIFGNIGNSMEHYYQGEPY